MTTIDSLLLDMNESDSMVPVPHDHAKALNDLSSDQESESDTPTAHDLQGAGVGRLSLVFFLIPILGILMCIFWIGKKPEKAKTAGYLALWGINVNIVLQYLI